MEKKSDQNESGGPEPQENRRGNNSLFIALILAGLVVLLFYNRGEERSLISASFFQQELERGNVESVSIGDRRVYGTFVTRPEIPTEDEAGEKADETAAASEGAPTEYLNKFVFNRSNDAGWVVQLENQLKEADVEYDYLDPDNTQQILYFIALIGLPLGILFFLFMMLRRTRSDIMGGGFLSGLRKSAAKRF